MQGLRSQKKTVFMLMESSVGSARNAVVLFAGAIRDLKTIKRRFGSRTG